MARPTVAKNQWNQFSQYFDVTNGRLVSSSAYFPWNMTLKYKMKLSEGSWDKILHSKLRAQCFWKEEFIWRFVSRSDVPKFRKYFSLLLCEDYQGKLTTLMEPLNSFPSFASWGWECVLGLGGTYWGWENVLGLEYILGLGKRIRVGRTYWDGENVLGWGDRTCDGRTYWRTYWGWENVLGLVECIGVGRTYWGWQNVFGLGERIGVGSTYLGWENVLGLGVRIAVGRTYWDWDNVSDRK